MAKPHPFFIFRKEAVNENGEVFSDVQYDSYSKEAYELYFDLWGEDEMYVYNEKLGNYVYIEDEE